MYKPSHFRLALFLLLAGLLWHCEPVEQQSSVSLEIDLKDPEVQRIYDFQDRQMTDSLLSYFQQDDPLYRYLSAMAFASVKAPEAVRPLAGLLSDNYTSVRRAAAYAMGQTGSAEATSLLMESFERNDTAGYFAVSNAAILEAVGKTGDEDHLELLSTISTYRPTDTLLLLGQTRGIYRFALRGLTSQTGTERMIELVTDQAYPVEVRVMAANYLYRAADIDLSGYGPDLAQLIFKEDDSRIRMTLAIALGKAGGKEAQAALLQLFRMENDYRVRCNILRALVNFPYDDSKSLLFEAVKAPQVQVAKVAADQLLANGDSKDATTYWRLAKDSVAWQVSTKLYAAAHRHLPAYYADYRDAINGELRVRYRNSTNVYEQAALLQALSEFGWNYRFIQREGLTAESPVVRTAAATALSNILSYDDFVRYFGAGYRRVKREIGLYLKDGIRSGDAGVVAVAAQALANLEEPYREYLLRQDSSFMDEGLELLELPRQIETYHALMRTQAIFRGEEPPEPRTPQYNHPIDWSVLVKLRENARATIRTNKGDITLELLPELAPGSVANFVQLAVDDFYNGKTFHRVVPNFVIQGGCPRGDGFGSLDYTIRSELPDLYYDQAGYVGMASAGNHTEGTQFFITHSPTPHLDGNYTIFARVISGMNVVHSTVVGDQIERIDIE